MSQEDNSKVPKLPDLNLSGNALQGALSSVKVDPSNLKVSKITLDSINVSPSTEQRPSSPRSGRRLTQIQELDESAYEIKPRIRRISNRDKSENSTSTHSSHSTTTTTTSTTTSTSTSSATSSAIERTIAAATTATTASTTTAIHERSFRAISTDSTTMKLFNQFESTFDSNLLKIENTKVTTSYEGNFEALEKSADNVSSMIKQLNEIKSLQDQRNQQIRDKNNKMVLLCNQRRKKIQNIYHHNYLMKKAFLRKKYNSELNYLYQKRQRDIELLQIEQKKRRQKKYVHLKKQMKQQRQRKIRLLQIQQREAQIGQATAYYLKKREIQKKRLLLLKMYSKVTNYSQTEDPSVLNNDDYYSDDYYSDEEDQENIDIKVQERGISININDENQQIQETHKIEKNQTQDEKKLDSQEKSSKVSNKDAKIDDSNANQATEKSAQNSSNESDFSDLLTKGAICFVLAATIFRALQVAF